MCEAYSARTGGGASGAGTAVSDGAIGSGGRWAGTASGRGAGASSAGRGTATATRRAVVPSDWTATSSRL